MNAEINEIGGYFALDFILKKDDNSFALNCARNCLRYVIRAFKIKEIYLPYYTCPVIWQAVQKEKCKIKFYHINENFYPLVDFPKDAFILYTNYFGVCAGNVKKLASIYQNLIIDNAQAFYMPKYGIASFNSIRKFFGVSDGAYLYTDKLIDNEMFKMDTSYQRFSHLLKRIDVNAKFGYDDFLKNDDSFVTEDIKLMSNLTRTIINSIDLEEARRKRIENFKILENFLKDKNLLPLKLDVDDVPMVYPYLIKDANIRKNLLKNKIYVDTYWSPMPEEYYEGIFQKYLIPLPIDQRYEEKHMNRILEIIRA